MNSSGWIRGMLAKSMVREAFLLHVIQTVERQLHLWSDDYQVTLLEDLMGGTAYILKINDKEMVWEIVLEKSRLDRLQAKSPYALDQYIWRKLKVKGLCVEPGDGNYLVYCAV